MQSEIRILFHACPGVGTPVCIAALIEKLFFPVFLAKMGLGDPVDLWGWQRALCVRIKSCLAASHGWPETYSAQELQKKAGHEPLTHSLGCQTLALALGLWKFAEGLSGMEEWLVCREEEAGVMGENEKGEGKKNMWAQEVQRHSLTSASCAGSASAGATKTPLNLHFLFLFHWEWKSHV